MSFKKSLSVSPDGNTRYTCRGQSSKPVLLPAASSDVKSYLFGCHGSKIIRAVTPPTILNAFMC
jgi:hypothetical protein